MTIAVHNPANAQLTQVEIPVKDGDYGAKMFDTDTQEWLEVSVVSEYQQQRPLIDSTEWVDNIVLIISVDVAPGQIAFLQLI